jgi:hypothetical protein
MYLQGFLFEQSILVFSSFRFIMIASSLGSLRDFLQQYRGRLQRLILDIQNIGYLIRLFIIR